MIYEAAVQYSLPGVYGRGGPFPGPFPVSPDDIQDDNQGRQDGEPAQQRPDYHPGTVVPGLGGRGKGGNVLLRDSSGDWG